MSSSFSSMLIGITVKYGMKDSLRVVQRAIRFLKQRKVQVEVCEGTCKLVPHEKPKLDFHKVYDLLIVFGGDGTLLRTVQFMRNFEVPVLSINMGRVGFFAEGNGKDTLKILEKVLSGATTIDQRMLLRCTVKRGERRAFSQRALNEVTIARDALARMVSLKTTVNDLKLTTYTADGLIVSTPTGSTSYSLSAGGPIVAPDLESMILTPIAPHSFAQKPIVIPPSSRIKIDVSTSQGRVYLTVDGQRGFHLMESDVLQVKRSSKSLKFLRLGKHAYFQTLREKLHWGKDFSS